MASNPRSSPPNPGAFFAFPGHVWSLISRVFHLAKGSLRVSSSLQSLFFFQDLELRPQIVVLVALLNCILILHPVFSPSRFFKQGLLKCAAPSWAPKPDACFFFLLFPLASLVPLLLSSFETPTSSAAIPVPSQPVIFSCFPGVTLNSFSSFLHLGSPRFIPGVPALSFRFCKPLTPIFLRVSCLCCGTSSYCLRLFPEP